MRLRTKLYYAATGYNGLATVASALGHLPLRIVLFGVVMTAGSWHYAEYLLNQDYPQTKPEEKKDGE